MGQGEFEGRELVTISEACRRVGVSRRTIYNWLEQGKLQTIRTAGGSLRVFTDTLWRASPTPKPLM